MFDGTVARWSGGRVCVTDLGVSILPDQAAVVWTLLIRADKCSDFLLPLEPDLSAPASLPHCLMPLLIGLI